MFHYPRVVKEFRKKTHMGNNMPYHKITKNNQDNPFTSNHVVILKI